MQLASDGTQSADTCGRGRWVPVWLVEQVMGFVLSCAFWSAGLEPVLAEPSAAELLNLHTHEAESYRMYRDAAQTEELMLRTTPIFSWTNLGNNYTEEQHGQLFVWRHHERPEVIGTIFSTRSRQKPERIVVHEFHTLSAQRLYPVTPKTSRYQWNPERGITLTAIDDEPPVAANSTQRLIQLRSIARSFEAETKSPEGEVWQLRLLPSPLLKYEPTGSLVVQGALFAMVSSAGTDPELLLLIEASKQTAEGTPTWKAAALRFSDKDLTVTRRGKPLWSSLTQPEYRATIKDDYQLIDVPDQTYRCYRARVIAE